MSGIHKRIFICLLSIMVATFTSNKVCLLLFTALIGTKVHSYLLFLVLCFVQISWWFWWTVTWNIVTGRLSCYHNNPNRAKHKSKEAKPSKKRKKKVMVPQETVVVEHTGLLINGPFHKPGLWVTDHGCLSITRKRITPIWGCVTTCVSVWEVPYSRETNTQAHVPALRYAQTVMHFKTRPPSLLVSSFAPLSHPLPPPPKEGPNFSLISFIKRCREKRRKRRRRDGEKGLGGSDWWVMNRALHSGLHHSSCKKGWIKRNVCVPGPDVQSGSMLSSHAKVSAAAQNTPPSPIPREWHDGRNI